MARVVIDTDVGTVTVGEGRESATFPMMSKEAFEIVSRAWLRCGWDVKHVYSFTWLGRPIIQLPEDMVRVQEVIYHLKPTVIVETGVAHGGSLIFYASLCRLLGRGKVIGVDIEIRQHNRMAIESHELYPYISLIEGASTELSVLEKVKSLISHDDVVLVILDSNHSKAHVLAELRAYGDLVTKGSYIIAADGIAADVVGAPRTQPDWNWNNPVEAVKAFLLERDDFVQEQPAFDFNEGMVVQPVTYWPGGYLRKTQ